MIVQTLSLHFKVTSFIFFTLFFIVLPFDYALWPDVNSWFHPFISSTLSFVSNLFHLDDWKFFDTIYSDSSGHYIFTALSAFISIIISWLLVKWLGKFFWSKHRLDAIQAVLAFYLSFFMLRYGIDKLFFNQFYPPSPIDLYSSMAFRTKDIVYWNLMGVSKPYMFFTGLVEVIPAILLWFRKTRGLGAALSAFVLSNVVMINFGFDISVKLLSIVLLSLAIILASGFFFSILNLIRHGMTKEKYLEKSAIGLFKSPVTYAATKAFVIIFILAECTWPFFKTGLAPENERMGQTIQGVWSLDSISMNRQETWMVVPFEFLIFNKGKNALIIKNGRKQNFKFLMDDGSLKLFNDKIKFSFNYKFENTDLLLLNDSVNSHSSLRLNRMPLNDLPIQKKGFHWTLDAMLND